jgi:hypothetical protein
LADQASAGAGQQRGEQCAGGEPGHRGDDGDEQVLGEQDQGDDARATAARLLSAYWTCCQVSTSGPDEDTGPEGRTGPCALANAAASAGSPSLMFST